MNGDVFYCLCRLSSVPLPGVQVLNGKSISIQKVLG